MDARWPPSPKGLRGPPKEAGTGHSHAKAKGLYAGRPEDTARNEAIMTMLRSKHSWNTILRATGMLLSLARLAKSR